MKASTILGAFVALGGINTSYAAGVEAVDAVAVEARQSNDKY